MVMKLFHDPLRFATHGLRNTVIDRSKIKFPWLVLLQAFSTKFQPIH